MTSSRLYMGIASLVLYLLLPAVSAVPVRAQVNAQARHGDDGTVELGKRCVIVPGSGDCIVVGEAMPARFDHDICMLRTDVQGALLWGRLYDVGMNDQGNALVPTSDGNFVMTGYLGGEGPGERDSLLLMKIDGGGDVLWCRTYGGSGSLRGMEIIELAENGDLLIAGYAFEPKEGESEATADRDGLVVRTDASGNLRWGWWYAGPGSDVLTTLGADADGAAVAAGYSRMRISGEDMFMLNLASDGEPVWGATCGGAGNDRITSLAFLADGSMMCAGSTASWGAGGNDAFIMRMERTGGGARLRTFGAAGHDNALSMQVVREGDHDEAVVIAGASLDNPAGFGEWDVHVIRTPADLNRAPEFSLLYGSDRIDLGNALAIDRSTGGIVVAGSTAGFGTVEGTDVYLVRTGADGAAACASVAAADTSSNIGDVPVVMVPIAKEGRVLEGRMIVPRSRELVGHHIICPDAGSDADTVGPR